MWEEEDEDEEDDEMHDNPSFCMESTSKNNNNIHSLSITTSLRVCYYLIILITIITSRVRRCLLFPLTPRLIFLQLFVYIYTPFPASIEQKRLQIKHR